MKQKYIFLLLSIILLINVAYSQVVIFSEYETRYQYKDNKLIVDRFMRLKNIGPNPIIPGEIHFKIRNIKGEEQIAPEIENVRIHDKYNKTIESRIAKSSDMTQIIFTVWTPILPNFFYDIYMHYEIPFKPEGLLFYEIQIPREETTIPVKNGVTRFEIPKSYFITFAPDADVEVKNNKKILTFHSPTGNLILEYSHIPVPTRKVRGSLVFWSSLIVVLIISLVVSRIRRRRHRLPF